MPDKKEMKYTREPGLCVIRDDDHDWGGPGHEENLPTESKKIKINSSKKRITNE